MKQILITGGAGFIGSHFVEHIFNKYEAYKIVVLDALTYAGEIGNIAEYIRSSSRFDFWYGDINNLDLVSDLVAQSNMVVHFAAETHVARSLYSDRVFFNTDVLGTQALLHAVLKHRDSIERTVHISSSEVYGSAEYEPMDEEHPLNPTSPYAAAKAGADRLVYSYWASHDLPVTIVRPFNNYGPRQHLEKVIPRFITSCLLNEPLTIHGTGEAARDWIYVEDTINAIDEILHSPLELVRGETFNLATSRALSVLEIADMVTSRMNNQQHDYTFMQDRDGQVQMHRGCGKKILDGVGFQATTTFETGLDETIEWFVNNEESWRRQTELRKVPIKLPDGELAWY